MFRLYDKNETEIELPAGVKPLDIFISSINKERITERLEGLDGKVDYGYTYNERDIRLNVLLEAYDTQDYRLLRDSLNAVLDRTAYVAEEYELGKLYRIAIDEKFIPERFTNNQRFANGEVVCSMPGLPFAFSRGRTSDIDNNGISANDELWGFGMGLTSEDVSYTHSTQTFSIYNAGNVTVHPFQQDLAITIDNISGDSNGLELRNKTTGETFATTQAIGSGKTLKLDGPVVTLDGLQYLRNTNKRFISLSPGWNEFELTADATVQFDFKFYYV